MEYIFTLHASDMIKERCISESWISSAIEMPDWKTIGEDNNTHYFKSIIEFGGRMLHVVANEHVTPKRIVTVYFDRKARRQK